jgi:hypothetical protein
VYASQVFGIAPQQPSYGVAAPTQAVGVSTDPGGWRALVDPHNPLVWFGAVLLVTVGAAGLAGSVRLGKATISASVNDKGD